jgi:hypothetical protein
MKEKVVLDCILGKESRVGLSVEGLEATAENSLDVVVI